MKDFLMQLSRYYSYPYLLWRKDESNELNGLYFGEWRVVDCIGTKDGEPYLLIHNQETDEYERVLKSEVVSYSKSNG